MRKRTMRGKRARAEKQGLMPSGRKLFGYDYSKETGRNYANDNLQTVKMIGMWLLKEGVSSMNAAGASRT